MRKGSNHSLMCIQINWFKPKSIYLKRLKLDEGVVLSINLHIHYSQKGWNVTMGSYHSLMCIQINWFKPKSIYSKRIKLDEGIVLSINMHINIVKKDEVWGRDYIIHKLSSKLMDLSHYRWILERIKLDEGVK